MDNLISVVGVTHTSDGQSTDTAKNSKFSKVEVTKGPYQVLPGYPWAPPVILYSFQLHEMETNRAIVRVSLPSETHSLSAIGTK